MKKNQTQMYITDRLLIEASLYANRSFKEIARDLRRHPATISREISTNRIFTPSSYMFENDCKRVRKCNLHMSMPLI